MSRDPAALPEPNSRRSFVFLQGPTSSVFRDLGRSLAARGHGVLKVNLCPGDRLFWRGADTVTYRGALEDWPAYLRALLIARQANDIVYFADRFVYHRAAQEVARDLGVRPVSMEYGYLRPDWLILEEGGQSSYSHFPDSARDILDRAAKLPSIDATPRYKVPEGTEALCEAAFHLGNAIFSRLLTPRYAPDRYYPVLREFPAYVPRLVRRAINARPAARMVSRLAGLPGRKFLVPLQMQNDFQLRDNAPEGYQRGFIAEVLDSFRAASPADAHLVFKLHPMDNGLERWDRVVRDMAAGQGLSARVHVLDGGDLAALFDLVSGCVVINSTMGLRALQAGVPTCVRGVAIYDLDGLTHQGTLDAFWTEARPPDEAVTDALIRALAHGIHVRGTVYGAAGRAAFVRNATARLEQRDLHGAGLFVRDPPRLAVARRKGVRITWPARGPVS